MSAAARSQPRQSAGTYAIIVVGLLLWASAFPGIRVGLAAFAPGELALLRFGTASAVFAVYALATRMRLPVLRDLPVIAAAGATGITIYHVALNYGEVTVSAGAAALLIATVPIFTAIMSVLWLRERLSAWGWAGIAVAFAGSAVVGMSEAEGLAFDPGALLVLLAAVSSSAYFIISKPALPAYGSLRFTAYAIWAGTAPMLVFAPGLVRSLGAAPPSATLAVVYLGVFPGAIAYWMWSYALARMPASVLASFLYAQPVNAMLIAWLWIGEVPSALTVAGGAIALAGVALVNTLGAPRARVRIVRVDPADAAALAQVRMLFEEYNEWLAAAVCSTRLPAEIASLPAPYEPPDGALLLALSRSGEPLGCIGLRRHAARACEIKRLYVRPSGRGNGVGTALVDGALDLAREIGYTTVLLSTLPSDMPEALGMYRRRGFVETERFEDHTHAETELLFLRLELEDGGESGSS